MADLPTTRPTSLDRDNHRPARLPSCVTPVNTLASQDQVPRSTKTLHPQGVSGRSRAVSIPCSTWTVFRRSFATHACILTRVGSTAGLHRDFTAHTTLPYPSTLLNHKGLENM